MNSRMPRRTQQAQAGLGRAPCERHRLALQSSYARRCVCGTVKKKEYALGGGDVKQLLVHPDGGKALVLTTEKELFVELPAK